MTLSDEKTHITHIDDGFVFFGFHIQRRAFGDGRRVVLTIPSKPALRRFEADVLLPQLVRVVEAHPLDATNRGRASKSRLMTLMPQRFDLLDRFSKHAGSQLRDLPITEDHRA